MMKTKLDLYNQFRFNVQIRHPYANIQFDRIMPTTDYNIRTLDALVLDDKQQHIYLYSNINFETPKLEIYGSSLVYYIQSFEGFVRDTPDRPFERLLKIKNRLITDYEIVYTSITSYVCLSNMSSDKIEIKSFNENDLRWLNENNMWYLFD